MLWRQNQIRFELKEREQAAMIEQVELPNVDRERIDELTYLFSYNRDNYTSGEVIRRVLAEVDVREIFMAEESIEEIVKRIYTERQVPELESR